MHGVEVARAQLTEAQYALKGSETHLKSVIEIARALEATKKQTEEDLASCTVIVEALKKELATKLVRTREVVAEVEQHGERLKQLEDLVKDLSRIE